MIKNEEHAFKTFSKLLKEKQFPSVVLLCGKEQFLIDWAYDELVKANIDEAVKTMDLTVFDGKGLDFSEVKAAVETFPCASAKKLVGISDFTVLGDESSAKLSVNDEKMFLEILENTPKETIIIIKVGKADKRKKLYKAIEKNGKVFDFDVLSEGDLRAFIVKHFGNYGKKIELAATEYIIKNSGYLNKESDYGLYNLENDIKKISAYSESSNVIVSDVLIFLSENLQSGMFFMLDSLAAKNTEKALGAIHKMLKNGINEFQIIAMLVSQYELMLKITELQKEGLSVYVIAKTLKEHEFRVKKAYEFAKKYTREEMANLLAFVYNMDRMIKEGIMSPLLLFEVFVSMNAVPPERKR